MLVRVKLWFINFSPFLRAQTNQRLAQFRVNANQTSPSPPPQTKAPIIIRMETDQSGFISFMSMQTSVCGKRLDKARKQLDKVLSFILQLVFESLSS